MILEIGGFVVASVIAAGVAMFASKGGGTKSPTRDVLSDYGIIKGALIKYRKENLGLVHEFGDLKKYLEPGQKVPWERYRLSSDEKFLITLASDIPNVDEIVNAVGGDSYALQNQLYLGFNTLSGKKDEKDFEPVAAFKIYPENITTMTTVHWDTTECKAVDGEILEYKWEKLLPVYDIPGEYMIKLKIRDNKGRWSNSATKKIVVRREDGIVDVAAGGTSLFVIHRDGKIDAQGTNDNGQLGTGNINPYRDREMLPLLNSVVQVEATDTHTLFRKIHGTVYAVGRNDMGQLGTGSKGDQKVAKEIWGIKNIIQISAGETFSAALESTGVVYTWGDNQHTQLGSERIGSKDMPMLVEGLTEIKHISMGHTHGHAVRQDGTVYSWGGNEDGQLGLGFKSRYSEINLTKLKNIEKAVAGKNFGFAIDKQGAVFGWGDNSKNQLGIVGQHEILFPMEIPGLKNIVDLKTYSNYTVALDKYGNVYTWGKSHVLHDNYPERPKHLDHLPMAKSIAIADRYIYMLTADERVLRYLSGTTSFEEMPLKIPEVHIDDVI